MTTTTQARLTPSPGPHTHTWHIDFEHPSRSTCACGKEKRCKPIPWSDSEATPKERRRAKAGRKAKRVPAAPAFADAGPRSTGGKRQWKWGPRG